MRILQYVRARSLPRPLLSLRKFGFGLLLILTSHILASCFSSGSGQAFAQDDPNIAPTDRMGQTEEVSTNIPESSTEIPYVEGCVTTNSLRVRSGPGTEFAMIGGLAHGVCVILDGQTADGSWVRISSEVTAAIRSGWLAASFLRLQGDETKLPIRSQQATRRPPGPAPTDTRWPTATTGAITPASSSGGSTGGSSCHPNYSGACLQVGAGDYDCAGGGGNGPNYVQGPVYINGSDPFGLDRDGDGVGCE